MISDTQLVERGNKRSLHVVEGEALEGPLVETLLLALVQAVHRLQPADKLLSDTRARTNLKISLFRV